MLFDVDAYFYFCFFKDLARILQGILNENKWGVPINLEVDLMFISTNIVTSLQLEVEGLCEPEATCLFFSNNYACLKK